LIKFGKDSLFVFAASHSLPAISSLVLSTIYSLFLTAILFKSYLYGDLTSLDLDVRYLKSNFRFIFRGFHNFFLALHFLSVTSQILKLLIV